MAGSSETLIMRLTDGMLTVPTFFLALLVLAVFGSNIANVVLVIGLTGWMVVARVVRAEVLRTLPQEFVLASRALGASEARVLLQHLLQELIYRDAPIVWIYHQTEILAMNKRVKGYPDLSLRDALPWAHQIAVQ
jgi:ABC-type dipeptide/oligopeptide/nickel transport system permease subunit